MGNELLRIFLAGLQDLDDLRGQKKEQGWVAEGEERARKPQPCNRFLIKIIIPKDVQISSEIYTIS